MFDEKIGIGIRNVREAKGYSQEYLAMLLNVSQTTISKIESGETALSVSRLLDILKILKADAVQVLAPLDEQNKSKFSASSVTVSEPGDLHYTESKMVERMDQLTQQNERLVQLFCKLMELEC